MRTIKVWIGFLSAVGFNQAFALNKMDQAEIERVIASQAEDWNRSDMHAWSAPFMEDASFVNIFGSVFTGRQEIEDRHVKIHQSFLKNTKMKILQIQLREMTPQVVGATVDWKTEGFKNPFLSSSSDQPAQGVFTQVFLKENDRWMIASSHNGLKFPPSH